MLSISFRSVRFSQRYTSSRYVDTFPPSSTNLGTTPTTRPPASCAALATHSISPRFVPPKSTTCPFSAHQRPKAAVALKKRGSMSALAEQNTAMFICVDFYQSSVCGWFRPYFWQSRGLFIAFWLQAIIVKEGKEMGCKPISPKLPKPDRLPMQR